MDNKSLENIEFFIDNFSKVFSLPKIKSLLSIFGVSFTWIFGGETEILITIYAFILIDTALGITLAWKKKEVRSQAFFRVAIKSLVYFIMIIVSRMVDKHFPVQLAGPIMDSFLVGTEAISILENISLLGFPVPTKLIDKLQDFNKEGQKEDDKFQE